MYYRFPGGGVGGLSASGEMSFGSGGIKGLSIKGIPPGYTFKDSIDKKTMKLLLVIQKGKLVPPKLIPGLRGMKMTGTMPAGYTCKASYDKATCRVTFQFSKV